MWVCVSVCRSTKVIYTERNREILTVRNKSRERSKRMSGLEGGGISHVSMEERKYLLVRLYNAI